MLMLGRDVSQGCLIHVMQVCWLLSNKAAGSAVMCDAGHMCVLQNALLMVLLIAKAFVCMQTCSSCLMLLWWSVQGSWGECVCGSDAAPLRGLHACLSYSQGVLGCAYRCL
jgi:hypothetical protein